MALLPPPRAPFTDWEQNPLLSALMADQLSRRQQPPAFMDGAMPEATPFMVPFLPRRPAPPATPRVPDVPSSPDPGPSAPSPPPPAPHAPTHTSPAPAPMPDVPQPPAGPADIPRAAAPTSRLPDLLPPRSPIGGSVAQALLRSSRPGPIGLGRPKRPRPGPQSRMVF